VVKKNDWTRIEYDFRIVAGFLIIFMIIVTIGHCFINEIRARLSIRELSDHNFPLEFRTQLVTRQFPGTFLSQS